MDQQAAIDWLIGWFDKHGEGSVPGKTHEEKLEIDYFNAGLIDSLGVIELIADVEEKFHIRFDDLSFQDRRFSTITGLMEIVAELSSDELQGESE